MGVAGKSLMAVKVNMESPARNVPQDHYAQGDQEQPGRRFVWVYYTRDDGISGTLHVGEPGPYPTEPDKPDFNRVKAWSTGTRIEKASGRRYPDEIST